MAPERTISIIDPAPAVARHLVEVMQEEGLAEKETEGFGMELYSSGDPSVLKTLYSSLNCI